MNKILLGTLIVLGVAATGFLVMTRQNTSEQRWHLIEQHSTV